MNTHDMLAKAVRGDVLTEDIPVSILREGWDLLVKHERRDRGRSERSNSQRKVETRTRSGARVRLGAIDAAKIARSKVALLVGIDYWTDDLLNTAFPTEENGVVAKLKDFTLEMVIARKEMLINQVSGAIKDAAMMEAAADLISQHDAHDLGEAVRRASAAQADHDE